LISEQNSPVIWSAEKEAHYSCRVTPEITAQLVATMDHKLEGGGILATRLCSHMQDANLLNASKLNSLTGISLINTICSNQSSTFGHSPST